MYRRVIGNQRAPELDLQLHRLESLLAERKMTLRLTDAARKLIAKEGYDPAYGARPLKRAIQRLVQNPLAIRVLEGEFDDGDTIVVSHRSCHRRNRRRWTIQ